MDCTISGAITGLGPPSHRSPPGLTDPPITGPPPSRPPSPPLPSTAPESRPGRHHGRDYPARNPPHPRAGPPRTPPSRDPGGPKPPPASPTLPSPTWGGSRAPEDPASPLRPPQITISLQIANPSSPHNGSCRDGGLGRITIFCLATAARRPLIGGIRAWEGAASVRCNRDRNISV